MRLLLKTVYCITVMIAVGCSSPKKDTVNYYFDPAGGNDANTGVSADQAFKSLGKIKQLQLKPGDSVLLRSGAVFTEQLYISCKGDSLRPVVVGKYGGDARPHIKGDTSYKAMVHVFNSEHIVVRDLEVSNKGPRLVNGLKGVLVELKAYGDAKNTSLDNLFVHDVGGGLTTNDGGGVAIALQNAADKDSTKSRFINMVVENCTIKDCSRDGIRLFGQWIRGKWHPNLGVVIRKNSIDGVPGDGIVVSGCDGALIEYNVMKNSPKTLPPSEACDGIWPWSSDNTLVQYNIVSDHQSIVDGYAYDSDWNCTNTTFQYNISYNNTGGFLLVIGTNGWPADWSINANENTQVRYNVSINDGHRDYLVDNKYFSPIIHVTGFTKNNVIEKNLFCIYPKADKNVDRTVIDFTEHDDSFGKGDIFRNNFISTSEATTLVKERKSVNNSFSGNLYVGPVTDAREGFTNYNGVFNKQMWYDAKDENWDKLLNFIGDKTIPIHGVQMRIKEIIGAEMNE